MPNSIARKILVASATTLMLSMPISFKSMAAYGTITDYTWYRSVVGVWVEVYGGESGWARIERTGDSQIANWRYETYGRPYSLHIGIGGTEENWAQNVHTGIIEDDKKHKNIDVYLKGWIFHQYYEAVVR